MAWGQFKGKGQSCTLVGAASAPGPGDSPGGSGAPGRRGALTRLPWMDRVGASSPGGEVRDLQSVEHLPKVRRRRRRGGESGCRGSRTRRRVGPRIPEFAAEAQAVGRSSSWVWALQRLV